MAVTTIKTVQYRDLSVTNAKLAGSIALTKLAESVIQADGGQAFTADQPMGSNKLTGLAAGTAAGDAVNKSQLDAATLGLSWKDSCVAASTADIDLAVASTPNPIDGVTVADGERVLLKSQDAAAENGIYIAVTAADPTTWTRATDMDAWAEVPSATVMVREGTASADTQWTCTSDDGGTLGTTAINFSQLSGSGATSAASVSADTSAIDYSSSSNVQDVLEDIDVMAGNRTYTNDNDVTDSESFTASIDALDTAHGNRTYTNDFIVTDSETFTASLDALDTAFGNRTYTENNVIADSESATASMEKLDLAFGDLYSVTASSEGVLEIGDRAARYSNFTGGANLGLTLAGIDTALGALEASSTPQTDVETGVTSATQTLSQTPDTGAANFLITLNGVVLNEGGSNDYTRSGVTVTHNITREAADVAIAMYHY